MSEFIKHLLPAQDDFVFQEEKHPAMVELILWYNYDVRI